MMTAYTICAVVGITIFIVQLILMFAGMGGDGDFDVGGDVGDLDAAGVDLADDGHVHMMEDTQVINEGGTSFFNILSFRSVIAAVAFFGVGGRLADELGWSEPVGFLFALGVGLAALVLVGWLMIMMSSLHHDGTLRMHKAIGQPASAYLGIPGGRSGAGRVSVTVQGRTMEFDAITDGDPIPTGGQVVVVDVINDTTVAVAPERSVAAE